MVLHYLMSRVLVYILATGTGPTVLKIKTMKGADGKPLNIVQKIAAGDYMTFGMCLLQDENGHEVELIEKNYKQDGVERVTLAILTKWLTSGAAPTRTYQHLIECLRQSELGTLADNIANTTGNHYHHTVYFMYIILLDQTDLKTHYRVLV